MLVEWFMSLSLIEQYVVTSMVGTWGVAVEWWMQDHGYGF